MTIEYTDSQPEIIEIIQESNDIVNGSWIPTVGQTTKVLEKKVLSDSDITKSDWETIKAEAIWTLSKCVSPNSAPDNETGLVMGYVQSGKTLSFTTVAALARDNGYQMIIVIAGTSTTLRDQSTNRLEKDLELNTDSNRRWQHFRSDNFDESDPMNIQAVLDEWQDPMSDWWDRQTVLITVMKHHQHLRNLASILSRIDGLSNVPTLVIDDEADQASLNTSVHEGEASSTYERILSLRHYLPHHTFLQYTATPQAPLLINLNDILSPNFVVVLTPGEKYVGGREFFRGEPSRTCRIPEGDIPTNAFPLDAPPDSLLEAMKIYFLGVATARFLERENLTGNRSMMIHPSHHTFQHGEYRTWVESVKLYWEEILSLDESDSDKLDLLEEFKNSYDNLKTTVPDLPMFEDLQNSLLGSIRKTQVHEINSVRGRTPGVPWNNTYSHILVGGQAMDRGYTVKGLTVTYMPRGRGVGNADTIQQRARFYGYKDDILGYCRVFLENSVNDAYEHYITHEEHVRTLLIEHAQDDKPLDAWKRAFFLDKSLKPTRKNVLDIDYSQGNFSNQWYTPKKPHDSTNTIIHNQSIVNEYLQKQSFQDDITSAKQSEYQHQIASDISLKDAFEKLLLPMRVTHATDSLKFTRVRLQIASYLDIYPNALCTVYRMSKGRLRERKLNKKDEIPTLFRGRSPKTGKLSYPGDSKMKGSGVTIQIHNLRVIPLNLNKKSIENVPAIAIWLPSNTSPDILLQDQGGNQVRD
ncbi:alpha-1,4 polygalactosaminidase [Candidatus Poribacteria bacterium]|nr:alpha-1,4 polygalactosaminidase [Candidatus Poribacteria bacterium]